VRHVNKRPINDANLVLPGIPITLGTVLYVIIGNSAAAIIFGWLYWCHGLEAAMIAYVVADIVLKVIVPRAMVGLS